MVKLCLEDSNYDLLLLQNEIVFSLSKVFAKTLAEAGLNIRIEDLSPPISENLLSAQPNIESTDFKDASPSDAVTQWSWYVYKHGVLAKFTFQDGNTRAYFFQHQVVLLLSTYISDIIDSGELIDLRSFRSLSLEQMKEEVIQSRGYWLSQAFEHYERSRKIVVLNYEYLEEHLRGFCGHIEDPDFMIWRQTNSVQSFLQETLRLLHNWLASCSSLVDHSRVFVATIEREVGPIPSYSDEVERRFSKDPLSQFVHKLRQVFQHCRLPGISASQRFGSGSVEGTVFLIKEDLLTFSTWNAAAMEYIEDQEGDIELLGVLKDYFESILDFQSWLSTTWKRAFRAELIETELKRQAFMAKEGEILTAEIEQSLAHKRPKTTPQFLYIFNRILTPEELQELAKMDEDPTRLAAQAIEWSKTRYFFSPSLCSSLMGLAKELQSSDSNETIVPK